MTGKDRVLKDAKRFVLVVFDIFSIVLSGYIALLLRFNGRIEAEYLENLHHVLVPVAAAGIVIFALLHLYRSLWQFASITELRNIIAASVLASVANFVICEVSGNGMPRSCYIIFFLFLTMLLGGSRFCYRLLRAFRRRSSEAKLPETEPAERVMIIGAGEAGEKVYREIVTSESIHKKKVVCFLDDDPTKWGRSVHSVLIYGGRNKIVEAARRFRAQEILVAIPSASRRELAEILTICNDTKCSVRKLPGIYQMINGEVHISDFKEVDIQDLLGRDPIEVNLSEIMDYVTDRVIMVTGGGGSIGSEICRQIADNQPKQLIIVDIYENNAYEIQQELKRNHPELNLATMIASIRNARKIDKLFETYHPDIVFHAAAHKHVPLMEDAPNEAVKNNVFGTLNVVKAADKYHADRFILISTDKAVNPTNIMGATKRICEMIVQAYDKKSETDYVAVRFGNVLGSNGSVIPLFEQQIREGGPVTVTHPDIIRYFMTIPEAVSLVLQAGAYAKGGEIFVLDMGEPVRIADMAKNLIKLSGLESDVDIKIEYTGLRPGEKLYEELLMDEEGLQDTPNHTIHIGKPIEMDEDSFFDRLQELEEEAWQESDDIRTLVKELVPTYSYSGPKASGAVRSGAEAKADSQASVHSGPTASETEFSGAMAAAAGTVSSAGEEVFGEASENDDGPDYGNRHGDGPYGNDFDTSGDFEDLPAGVAADTSAITAEMEDSRRQEKEKDEKNRLNGKKEKRNARVRMDISASGDTAGGNAQRIV